MEYQVLSQAKPPHWRSQRQRTGLCSPRLHLLPPCFSLATSWVMLKSKLLKIRGETLKTTKTIHCCVSLSSDTGDTPSTDSTCGCHRHRHSRVRLLLKYCALTGIPSPIPSAATHFTLGPQRGSEQLHSEAVGMKEHGKELSLGLTCRKALSNMQTGTQLQYSGGGERRILTCVYIWYNIHTGGSLSFIEFLFSKIHQDKYAY